MTRLALATTLALALALPIAAGAADSSSSKQEAFTNPGQTYEMTGTISKAEKSEVTLTRQGLPNAQLDIVADKTKVTMNGRSVSSDQLQPGMEVRAQFQVVGTDVVATQIQASPHGSQGSQGSQAPGSQAPGSQAPGSQAPGSQAPGSQGSQGSQGY